MPQQDGKKSTDEFAPANQSDFDHGAAPEIDTITSFIVNRLDSPCQAPEQTKQVAKQAEKAVSGMKGQMAADAWNRMLGLSSGGSASASASGSGNMNVKVVYVRMRRVRRGDSYWEMST
jgi:hypothetical protein